MLAACGKKSIAVARATMMLGGSKLQSPCWNSDVPNVMKSMRACRPLAGTLLLYLQIPEEEREQRCLPGSDDCIIDEQYFFVRGCIDIPVSGQNDVFTWGV